MFIPFPGWLFDPATVTDPGNATSPPYDVISDDDRDALLERSPYNIVRLLLPGRDRSGYDAAADLLADWQQSGVLVRDDMARFYLYEIDYEDDTGHPRRARGVVGALELVPLGTDVVPHEETMGEARADRMSTLQAIRANLDPIIALSAAPELPSLLTRPAGPARLEFGQEDGTVHRLFDIADSDATAAIRRLVSRHPVAIADGHHRYTTALAYRGQRAASAGSGPWDFIMALVAPAEGSGLTIGPYHRILPRCEVDPGAVDDAFEIVGRDPVAPDRAGHLVVVGDGTALHLQPRPDALSLLPSPWREASTAIARELLYPRLGIDEKDARYVADASDALSAAASGSHVAVLVAPVSEHAVADAGEMGIRFPTKTTYFTPKPRAGLVIRSLDG